MLPDRVAVLVAVVVDVDVVVVVVVVGVNVADVVVVSRSPGLRKTMEAMGAEAPASESAALWDWSLKSHMSIPPLLRPRKMTEGRVGLQTPRVKYVEVYEDWNKCSFTPLFQRKNAQSVTPKMISGKNGDRSRESIGRKVFEMGKIFLTYSAFLSSSARAAQSPKMSSPSSVEA